MKSTVEVVRPRRKNLWLRTKPVTILAIIAVGIALGYLFFLSWLFGVLLCKFVSGGSTGEKGKLKSIVIPVRWRKIHLHHWLYAICLLVFSVLTGIYLLMPIVTYGFLGGLVFHGIYNYSDWHKIVVSRHEVTPSMVERSEVGLNGQAEFAISEDTASYTVTKVSSDKV